MTEPMLCVGRQPIVDREGRIYGFELLSRQPGLDRAVITDGALSTSRLLASVFSVLSTEEVLGEKHAFVNLNLDLLNQRIVELFPPDRLVLEILETVTPDDRLMKHCLRLKAKGYRIALDDFVYSKAWFPLLQIADFVKLDFRAYDRQKLRQQVQLVRRPHLRLIAEKVETEEERRVSQALGFDYFQGYFFARPTTLSARDVSASQVVLIQLLNKARAGADLNEVEETVKRDVGLSYKLLCYVNSVGFGLRYEVTSVGHALAMLGQKQLYRWLTLMVALSGPNPSPALTAIAIVRGRLMELLTVRSGLIRQSDHDAANLVFMTGMFSLLDALLELPMAAVLHRIRLAPDVERALMGRGAPYGPYLDLIEASEVNDARKIDALGRSVRLDNATVCRSTFEAMAWSESLAF